MYRWSPLERRDITMDYVIYIQYFEIKFLYFQASIIFWIFPLGNFRRILFRENQSGN